MKRCSAVSKASPYRAEHRCEITHGVVIHPTIRVQLCSRHTKIANGRSGVELWKDRRSML